MEEIWKDVIGYDGLYKVSNHGRLLSIKPLVSFYNKGKTSNVMIKGMINHKGYNLKGLSKNGIKKNISIHRIVAIHFIPNPFNHPQVNHIDGDKLNNHVENLEWCTAKENMRHCVDNGMHNTLRGKDVANSKMVFDMQTGVFFDTIKETAFAYNINYKYLSAMLKNTCRNKTQLRTL